MEQINKDVKLTGIVHFWELPDKIHTILEPKFKAGLMTQFMKVARTKYNANKITGISRPIISDYINKKRAKIRIDFLMKIAKIADKDWFSRGNIEKNVIWIGNFNSLGIARPKLPFDFNSKAGARFVAAICNEGWISGGMYYSNSKAESRAHVKNDALAVLGGKSQAVKERVKEKDQYLAFPSIMRDVINILTDFKGVKAEKNPNIPSFVLKDKEFMYGWLEQTIGDEGHVKFYPDTYRREIIWRRSCDTAFETCNLIADELKILKALGITYDLKKIGMYVTCKNKQRFRSQIRLSKKENLKKLAGLIRIPDNFKNKLLIMMLKSC